MNTAEFATIPQSVIRTEKPGAQPDAGEVNKLGETWRKTLTFVFAQNQPVIIGAVDPSIVALDEKCLAISGADQQKEWVEKIVQERKEKRTKALEDAQITEDLKTQNQGREPTPTEIQQEKNRCLSLQNTYDTLYAIQALEYRIKQAVNTEEQKIRDDKKRDPTGDEKKDIRKKALAKYWDGNNTYYQYDEAGNRTELPYSETFAPIYTEAERISKLTTDGEPDGQPTKEAGQAKLLLENLHYDAKENKFAVASAEAVKTKESREREENQVELVCRVIKEIVGIDVAKAIKDANKGKDGDIAQDLLKKIDPSKPLGSLALRLSAYLSLPPDFPAEERSILSSLLFEELKSFQQDLEVKGSQPELLRQIRDFHEQNRSYFEGHFNTFKKLVLLSAGYSEKKQIDDLIPKLHSNRLADGVVLAYACQNHVEEKKGEEPQLKEAAYNALQAFLKENRFTELEATIFNSLAVNKSAGALLKRIGLDPEELKKPDAVGTATQRVVDEMNKRRKPGESPPSEKESANYREVLKYHTEGSLNKINPKHPLAGWLKAIGMLALILGPSFQRLLNETGGDSEQQREGG